MIKKTSEDNSSFGRAVQTIMAIILCVAVIFVLTEVVETENERRRCPKCVCGEVTSLEVEIDESQTACIDAGGFWSVEYIKTTIGAHRYLRRWWCDLSSVGL